MNIKDKKDNMYKIDYIYKFDYINPSIDKLLNEFNFYKNSHPNLVSVWTNELELKKKHYRELELKNNIHKLNLNYYWCDTPYTTILDYMKGGNKDYTVQDIFRIMIYKQSLLL